MRGVGLYAGFHHAHIIFGNGERPFTVLGKTMECGMVIASAHPAHIQIIIDGSHPLPDSFRTGDDRGVVVEPRHPMMDGLWTLVGNEAHYNLTSGTDLRDNDTIGVFHRHILRAALSTVHGEYAVKHLVVQGMIHLRKEMAAVKL